MSPRIKEKATEGIAEENATEGIGYNKIATIRNNLVI